MPAASPLFSLGNEDGERCLLIAKRFGDSGTRAKASARDAENVSADKERASCWTAVLLQGEMPRACSDS